MRYSEEVKQLAYKMDPECWVSYSGATPDFKRAMDKRRTLSLEYAERYEKCREVLKVINEREGTIDYQAAITSAVEAAQCGSLLFEKDSGKAVPPKSYKLQGKTLKVGDVVLFCGVTTSVKLLTEDSVSVCTVGSFPSIFTVRYEDIEKFKFLVRPQGETPDTQAELRHYYDTVITDMCKGTTVKPWECVRYARDKMQVSPADSPLFTRPKEEYEFALAVHLDRPVWVGSVLYVGDGQPDTGTAWEVEALTPEDSLLIVPRGKQGGAVNVTQWRNWAVWEKPVKQQTPTRVKVGYCNKHYVSVPEQITGKGTARLVLDFGSNKDAAEFYEVFKNLIGEKEAQG